MLERIAPYWFALLFASGAAIGCQPQKTVPLGVPPRLPSPPPPTAAARPAEDVVDLGRWQPTITSPRRPAAVVEPDLVRRCGSPDEALQKVAATLATGGEGATTLDMPRLEFELRVAGAPYVWPHLWTVASKELDPKDVAARFDRWLSTFADGGQRRCGLARLQDKTGRDRIVAVVVDALADLEPLPSYSSIGRWLELEARLVAPASAASVVLLGPRGRPQTVPSSLSDNVIKARFAPSAPGRWLVQVVAVTDTGPRPIARAVVHVDTPPPEENVSLPVPGEEAARTDDPPDAALTRMLNAARVSEGLRRLPRSRDLDSIALAHAAAMLASGRLGHDVGHGTVRTRLDRAGIVVATAGENVARAGSIERAHRVLWESPSHRDTLLYDRYDAVGVGVATEPNGTAWVCEVFARF